MHRFFRIYPVYLFVFVTIGILTGVIYWDKVFNDPWGLIVNLVLLQQLFPKELIFYDVLHVSWTLTVEVIWYLLAPLMIFFFRNHLNFTLISAMIISTAWVYFATVGSFDSIYIHQVKKMNLTLDEYRNLFVNNAFIALLCYFFIGAFIYYKQHYLIKINRLTLGAVFILCTLFFLNYAPPVFRPNFISGIGLGALFVFALASPTLYSKPIKLMADISYSFYLTHFVIILIVYHHLGLHEKWYALFVFAVTVIIATVLYYLIERPMISLARKLSR